MPENSKFPLIVGHRGASASAPENTLAAFARAIDAQADGIEFDVRMAKDNVPVVFHDAGLQRMAQKKARVSSLTSIELQTLDLGRWFNQRFPRRARDEFSGETIPTLAQAFAFLHKFQGRIYVELKGFAREMPATVEAVIKEIRQTDLLPNVILKSFDLGAIAEAKRLIPEIRTAALFAPKILSVLRGRQRLIEEARGSNADELSLHYSLATKKLIERAASESIPVTIWTADRPSWVRRARELGIKAIITNNPARFVAERDRILREERSAADLPLAADKHG
jgi:glycerophosphoryl diester phosphodiesterase